MNIDHIYILALNPTQEKLDLIKKKLDNCHFNTTPYDILRGHDGRTEPIPEGVSVYDNWQIEGTPNAFWKQPVTPGEIGCTLSHIAAWKRAKADGGKRVLILEEDFASNFPFKNLPEPKANTPIVWDMINLGRWIFDATNDISIDTTYCIPSLHYNMHAYILTDIGVNKLLDYELEKNLFINDEFITATYTKHRRPDIEALYPIKNMHIIATREDWFNQDGTSNTVSMHGPQEWLKNHRSD